MPIRAIIAFIVLAHGLPPFGGGHALAQGFNRRHDVLGQGLQENGWSIERSGDNYLVVGTTPCITFDNIYYNPIIYTVLVNAQGDIVASDTLVYPSHAVAPGMWNCMAPRRGGGFVAGGGTLSQTETYRHALWVLEPSGTISLVAEYGGEEGFNTSRQAIECKDGGFLLVGQTDSTGALDASLVRTDSVGGVLWSRTYGGPYFDSGWSVDTTADDGFFVGGLYGSAPGVTNPDLWVFRVDAVGDTLWSRIWGEEFNDLMTRLTTKANGNPVVATGIRHFEDDEAHSYMAELDANDGSFIWEREYGPAVSSNSLTIAKEVAPGAGHIAVGALIDNIGGFDSGIMLRTNDGGDSLWMRTFYYHDSLVNYGWGYLYDVVSTEDGGFIACGTSHGEVGGPLPPGYSQDLWIVKVDSLGCIIPGCDDIPLNITSQITNMAYALNLYANPVLEQLHVGIILPTGYKTEGPLVLSVTSLGGKLVQQQMVPTSASCEVVLQVGALAAGVYAVHLSDARTWIAGKQFIVE